MYIANYLAERKQRAVRLHTQYTHAHAYIACSSYTTIFIVGEEAIEKSRVYNCANREP